MSLKAFEVHGFVQESHNPTQYIGKCPFCGRSKHFYISKEDFLWDCKRCSISGNLETFLHHAVLEYEKQATTRDLISLTKSRSIRPKTFRAWGVGFNGRWYSIPMSGNPRGTVMNIKRYTLAATSRGSYTTHGCKQCFMAPKKVPNSHEVYVCEGEWDGMRLWEELGGKKAVYAVPGSDTFPLDCLSLFQGKVVYLCYDNDTAGYQGTIKAYERLQGIASSVHIIHWPDDAPEGYDIRDYFMGDGKLPELQSMFDTTLPMRARALLEEKKVRVGGPEHSSITSPIVYSGKGMRPSAVAKTFTKWLTMGSTECLDVMFGSVFANRLDGDPLWLFLVAPPGGMKTEILLTLSGGPGIVETTSLTPHALVSGANFGGGDPSLVPKLDGKLLVIKDFTPILSMNSLAREEILSVLRDVYDGKTQKWFGNGIIRNYESKFGIIAGVTPAIEQSGSSATVLGERFIRYRMSDSGRITGGRDKIMKALSNLRNNTDMRDELRECGNRVIDWDTTSIPYPEVSHSTMKKIAGLAQWVGTLRGVVSRERYTGQLNFKPMAEIGTRLAKQMLKLGYGISIYKRDPTITEETYYTLTRVARSTAPDRVEEVVKQIYSHVESHKCRFETKDIIAWTHFPAETLRILLSDLSMLNILVQEKRTWGISRGVYSVMRDLELYEHERKWIRRNV